MLLICFSEHRSVILLYNTPTGQPSTHQNIHDYFHHISYTLPLMFTFWIGWFLFILIFRSRHTKKNNCHNKLQAIILTHRQLWTQIKGKLKQYKKSKTKMPLCLNKKYHNTFISLLWHMVTSPTVTMASVISLLKPCICKNHHTAYSDTQIYNSQTSSFCLFDCVCFMAQSTTRSCRASQLTVALFLGRLRPSKRLTSTKWGRPWQKLTTTVGV